jgi:serine/threonine-protein kinase
MCREHSKRIFARPEHGGACLSYLRSCKNLTGRYRIERELGAGGMATVYLARDIQHERPVALKVLHPELAVSLGAERFQREIRTAAKLQHPHILGVHDSGSVGEYLWFTMPFVEGEGLRERLTREGQLTVSEAVRITREAALALDFAHRHDVVHRDIKPENILLIDVQAMVADFGIARDPERRRIVGKPGWRSARRDTSPEQAMGDRSTDAHDVYARLRSYEMLAGEAPFTGPTAQAVITCYDRDAAVAHRDSRDSVAGGGRGRAGDEQPLAD